MTRYADLFQGAETATAASPAGGEPGMEGAELFTLLFVDDEDLRLSVSLALQRYVLLQENRRLREIAKRQQSKIKNYAALFDENRAVAGNILIR